MLQKIQITIIVLVLPLAAAFMYMKKEGYTFSDLLSFGTPVMHIGDIPMRVEIADTPYERERGLSGRADLEVNGMLFAFEKPDYYSIWMKDMRFSIDVIWIDENLTVVDITKNLTPDSYPKSFRPSVPIKYLVETDPNYSDTFGITIGKKVVLPIELRNK